VKLEMKMARSVQLKQDVLCRHFKSVGVFAMFLSFTTDLELPLSECALAWLSASSPVIRRLEQCTDKENDG
jgi:hypothetical protein